MVIQADRALAANDVVTALQGYERAAGDSDHHVASVALDRLGELYAKGGPVPQDLARAEDYFRRAALLGDPYAQAAQAEFVLDGIATTADPATALIWARKAAAAGMTIAFAQLGWQYMNGLGVEQSADEAKAWYLRGAEEGDANCQYQLGWLYAHTQPTDYREALKWYQRAAAQDIKTNRDPNAIATAQNNIGYLFEKGQGVQPDYRAAYGWYTQAAHSGSVRGFYHLGHLYAEGLGVQQDPGRARELMQQAAAHGDSDAAAWLASASGH